MKKPIIRWLGVGLLCGTFLVAQACPTFLLTSLTDSQAENLAQFKGDALFLNGITSLTDNQAESLAKFAGKELHLEGLSSLTDTQSESLAKFTGKIFVSSQIKDKFGDLFEEAKPPACAFPDDPPSAAPEWLCNPSVAVDSDLLVGMGSGKSSSAFLRREECLAEARLEIAKNLEISVKYGKGDQKSNVVIEQVTLRGTHLRRSVTSPKGTFYCLVTAEKNNQGEMPLDEEESIAEESNFDETSLEEPEIWDPFEMASFEVEEFTTKDIQFTKGTHWDKALFYDDLQDVADYMAANPEALMEIQGHSDTVGSASANKRLSLRRAKAVFKVLVREFGVDDSRLIVSGHGESNPKPGIDGKDPANRRVEIHLKK